MYTAGYWIAAGREVVTRDGEPVCVAQTPGDAQLLRCAADMYEFLQELVQNGDIYDRNRAKAERLLTRASGVGV
jgi:hypothetical protein